MKLYLRKPNGRYQEAGLKEVAAAYQQCTAKVIGKQIQSPADSKEFLKARIGHLEHESFCVIFLDNRHRVISFKELFRGTIDNTTVYPREVIKESLAENAAALILAHNHPSGVSEPSQADRLITKRIKEAADMLDIRVLDHFVIGSGDSITSLASRGML